MWGAIIQMIFQGVGSVLSTSMGDAKSRYDEKTLKNNAAINRAMAKDSISRGQTAESLKRKETSAKKSTQRATYGSSGIDVDTGSAARVQADTDMIGDIDALLIRENFKREADRYENAAEQDMAQANMIKKIRPAQRQASLLGGGSQVYSTWSNAASSR